MPSKTGKWTQTQFQKPYLILPAVKVMVSRTEKGTDSRKIYKLEVKRSEYLCP